jgi:hypothetical protein
MNIAFPALIIALLLLPGIVFRYAYSRGSWGWTSPVSFRGVSDELAYGAVFAVVIHLISLEVAALSGHRADGRSLLAFLTGNFGPTGERYEGAIASVADHPAAIGTYFLGVVGVAAITGRASHWLVRETNLDHRTQILRFKNEWHYLLTGEVLSFAERGGKREIDGVFLSAVVDHGKEAYLYRGIVVDWSFDSDGGLENVRLRLAHRRKLDADRTVSAKAAEYVGPDDRYYAIRGDLFVLRYSEMKTINLDYFSLSEDLSTTAEVVTTPPLT